MSSRQLSKESAATAPPTVPFRLEVVVIPVADFDRAKNFYVGPDGG